MKKMILLFAITFLLTGCAKNTDSNQKTEDEIREEDEIQKEDAIQEEDVIQEEETLWKVLDNNENVLGYLPDDSENVKQIVDLISEHCSYVDNRTPDHLSLEAEMELYTKGFQSSLNNTDYLTKVEEMYSENQISLEQKLLIWTPCTLDAELNYCKATVESEFTITDSSEEYLIANGLELNATYVEQRVYYLEKEKGNWKISNINKSALDKR